MTKTKTAIGFFIGDLGGKKQVVKITVKDLQVFNKLFLNAELQKRKIIEADIVDFDFAIKILTTLKEQENDKRI